MKKTTNTALFLIFILILTVSCFSGVSAGGGLIVLKEKGWEMLDEEKQLCAINYHNGIQNMILGVSTTKEIEGEKVVWIFPVPAKPEEIEISTVKGFPILYGFDVRHYAAYDYKLQFSLIRTFQIYTALPYLLGIDLIGEDKGISGIMMDPLGRYIGHSGVTINNHIKNMGLTTEVISALDSSSFSDYLATKDLDIPPKFKSILDEYIGEEYSFVVSWISDVEEFKLHQPESHIIGLLGDGKIDEARELFDGLNWSEDYGLNNTFEYIDRGVSIGEYNLTESLKYITRGTGGNILSIFISFPTDKIYYPLKFASVYGSKKVPATIYVMDYVKPELYPEIKAYSKVNYISESMYGENFKPKEELRDFFIGYGTKGLKYTKIKIDSPSKYLTEDLWIEKEIPFNVFLAEYINKFTFWFYLFFFVVCSCLASLIAGIIVFGFKKVSKLKFALFGLWNFLTLIGFWIAAYINKIDVKFAGLQEIQQNKTPFGKKFKITLFIALIVPTLFLLFLLFTVKSSNHWGSEFFIASIITYAFITVLVAQFVIGYYKNKRIIKFIVLFTVLFTLLTFLFEYLLNLIIT